jgi:hypothetical protein
LDQGDQLYTLPSESEKILLKHSKDKTSSISPLPLHKTLVLLEKIAAENSYSQHQRLAVAKALVTTIANLRFGPEVGVTKAKLDAPVLSPGSRQ